MQRLCSKLRSLAVQSSRRLLHSSSQLHQPLRLPIMNSTSTSTPFPFPASSSLSFFRPSTFHLSLVQVRHVSSRERAKRRKPMTPVTSKVKKIKMKSYSSYKSRFRTMNDGSIRRWREGKSHNAHSKSRKARRRLRQPSTVPAAYAKVMKKLNFCG